MLICMKRQRRWSQMVAEGSPAWRLWKSLYDIDGIGPVSASNLCARKRPRLLPIYDNYVVEFLGPLRTSWEALRQSLSQDGGVLARRLRRIGEAAGATDLSVLRVFDVIARCSAKAKTQ